MLFKMKTKMLAMKKEKVIKIFDDLCDSARIQTWNLLGRNQVLYSVKLRSHPSNGIANLI